MVIDLSSKIARRPKSDAPLDAKSPELLRAVGGTFQRLVSQFAGDDFL